MTTHCREGASGVAGSGSTPPAFAGVTEPRSLPTQRSASGEVGSLPKVTILRANLQAADAASLLKGQPHRRAPRNKIRTFDGINGFPPKRSEREPPRVAFARCGHRSAPDALAAEAEAKRL